MARKRDYVREIEEIRSRLLRRTSRWDQVAKRIHPLIRACSQVRSPAFADRPVRREIIRYVPVGAVSILEGWFRMAVADLLNGSKVCRKNAEGLRDVKFEPRDILGVHSKAWSVGELIANLIPVNRVSDIEEILDVILGEDFREQFKAVRINPESKPGVVTLANEVDRIFHALARTFELRHIFCHELATSFRFSAQEIEDCLMWVFLFLVGAEKVVQDVLRAPVKMKI